MVDLVQDFCTIQSTTTQSGGGTTDSVAQQALQQSAIALATAQQALAAAPNVRSGGPIAIPVGDSQITITVVARNAGYQLRGPRNLLRPRNSSCRFLLLPSRRWQPHRR
jgi:hypothetical protein